MDPADLVQCGSKVAGFCCHARPARRAHSAPEHIDDAMADLAMVFHWGPAEMDPMPLEELMDWRERARRRAEPPRTSADQDGPWRVISSSRCIGCREPGYPATQENHRSSEGTAQALRESREQLKTLERAQKDMRGFRDLKRHPTRPPAPWANSSRRSRPHPQMNNAEGATGDLTRKRAAAIRQAKKLKDRYRDEQRQLHELRGSMTRVEGVTGSYSDQQRQLAERIRRPTSRSGTKATPE
nr:GpE family phage tail protein [Halolamina pelagica]